MDNKELIILILAISFMVYSANCKLQIVNFNKLPQHLKDQTLLDIPYSVGNFGFAPFGKTMIADLQLSPGMNPECDPLEQIFDSEKSQKVYADSFMLIPRGQCKFVTKALHAQQLGARMAIIMDIAEHNRTVIMKDDGYGYKVKIPAIFINENYGDKLKKLAEQYDKDITLKIHFQSIKSDKVNVTFYLQSMNRMSYRIVQSFRPFYEKIKNKILLSVIYDVRNCPYCSQNDCYYDHKYCSIDYQHGSSANGKMIIDQQLRQKLMFNQHRNQWWDYMDCINDQCAIITQLAKCTQKCQKKVGITTLKKEFDNSFTSGNFNPYLDLNKDNLQFSGVDKFPTVSINDQKMKGSMQGQFIFDDICNSLNKPPSSCKTYLKQYSTDLIFQNKFYWVAIIIAIVVAGVIFFILFTICKRCMKNRMQVQMSGRVDDMVSKYIEFYSERNNSK